MNLTQVIGVSTAAVVGVALLVLMQQPAKKQANEIYRSEMPETSTSSSTTEEPPQDETANPAPLTDNPATNQPNQDIPPAIPNPPDASPLATYDVLVIKSIRSQWLASLPDKSNSQQGKVTVSFTILPNGSVSNIKILQTDLPIKFETLAQKAIQQAEPFPVWSPAIKQLLNADELHMMFTFEYKPS